MVVCDLVLASGNGGNKSQQRVEEMILYDFIRSYLYDLIWPNKAHHVCAHSKTVPPSLSTHHGSTSPILALQQRALLDQLASIDQASFS